MADMSPLTEAELIAFGDEWYHKLDIHAPMVELLPMLADEELEMQFPETTVYGHAGFEGWYQTVIRLFFNEVHKVTELNVKLSAEQADVQIVVNWQAYRWNPPAAKREWTGFDAAQRLVFKRSPQTGKPVITKYIVDSLTPMEGSPAL